MNQKKENAERYFKKHLDDIAFFLGNVFQTEPEQLYVYNTLHWKNPEKYNFPAESYEDKIANHASQYPVDLQKTYDAGVRFALDAYDRSRKAFQHPPDDRPRQRS